MTIPNDRKISIICSDFERNARKKYPYKSMYQITKELNKMLEDLLYGKKR